MFEHKTKSHIQQQTTTTKSQTIQSFSFCEIDNQTVTMDGAIRTSNNINNESNVPPPQSQQPMDRERAAAIAEVSVMPENDGPPIVGGGTAGAGGAGSSRRATNELDDVVMQGDVQQLDEAGVQVRSLFLEFLYQL